MSAIIDRSTGFAADPHLRIEGTNVMDAAAPIRWGNGMSITPNGTTMELAAAGGITLLDNTGITGDLAVTGTSTMREGVITGVQLAGVGPARATLAVYDQRINASGDVIPKPTCPAGSTAQIFVAVASVPTGDNMVITTNTGNRVSGDIERIKATADNVGTQWQVWAEVALRGANSPSGPLPWIKLSADDGDLRSSIKCS